jgi:hypothetical protein
MADVVRLHKRPYAAFLSHAHADKPLVDRLARWLKKVADVRVWYDSDELPAGSQIAGHLPDAIVRCRSMIIVLSRASVRSGWVNEEYNVAVAERARSRGFRIIPIRIDDCEVPGFLQTTKWIDASAGLDASGALALLLSLYAHDREFEPETARDIYISRSWRDSEAALPDLICRKLDRAGFRLIGDAPDQKDFDENRVASIISGCGALVAIAPDRGNGSTSNYILREARLANSLGVPARIFAPDGVQLDGALEPIATRLPNGAEADAGGGHLVDRTIEVVDETWVAPKYPHYVFLGASLEEERAQAVDLVTRLIRHVTAMPCEIGDRIPTPQVQETIASRIRGARAVIADISAREGDTGPQNINICIEAGIARGAAVPLHLIAKGARGSPPFMFRDLQVLYYANDLELLGAIHQIARRYRKRVITHELDDV